MKNENKSKLQFNSTLYFISIFAVQARGRQRIFRSENRGEAEVQGTENPLPTKGLDCKDILISLLNEKKFREIMQKIFSKNFSPRMEIP